MTDLESPRKNNDCYFYYYSTCAKGDNCTFRHEPSALGCETMCSFWKEGKCLNVHCNFRHMELRKNRKAIPCYWESQPGGCLKPHCPFLHQNVKPQPTDETHGNKTDSGTESADNSMNEKLSHLSEKSFKNAPVDSLVVNFEEESDNESAPTNSPIKSSNKRIVKVKTWEEIKLERIQAESAALYSYPERESAADDLRQRILGRLRQSDDAVKRKMEVNLNAPSSKRQKVTDVNKIKIKTLDEIRAERTRKFEKTSPTICDNLVSSTQDIVHHKKDKNTKIKLQRAPAAYVEEYKNDDFVSAEGGAHTQENSLSDGECDVEGDTLMKTSKTTADEVLLLQDDDENSNVSLKDEERLLNDLDEFLED